MRSKVRGFDGTVRHTQRRTHLISRLSNSNGVVMLPAERGLQAHVSVKVTHKNGIFFFDRTERTPCCWRAPRRRGGETRPPRSARMLTGRCSTYRAATWTCSWPLADWWTTATGQPTRCNGRSSYPTVWEHRPGRSATDQRVRDKHGWENYFKRWRNRRTRSKWPEVQVITW